MKPIPKLEPQTYRPPKGPSPKKESVKPKQIVSVAGLFKQKPAPAFKPSTLKRKSSPSKKISPNKRPKIPKIQRRPEHPIAAHFNETTQAYRTHLHTQATSMLNSTYESLLTNLNNLNTTTITPSPTTSNRHPAPKTVPISTAVAEANRSLTSPLGGAVLRCDVKREDGSAEKVLVRLDERLRGFEKYVAEEEEELKKLGREWEGIVGEILRIGIELVGERELGILLGLDGEKKKEVGKDDGDDLFIPVAEDDSLTLISDRPSPHKTVSKSNENKKKPSTAPASSTPFPAFVTQPSLFKKPLPTFPELPKTEIEELERGIEGLGVGELEELRKIAREEQRSWSKKQRQIVALLGAD